MYMYRQINVFHDFETVSFRLDVLSLTVQLMQPTAIVSEQTVESYFDVVPCIVCSRFRRASQAARRPQTTEQT